MNISNAKSLAIHGRQPALGRAELESLYGADNIVPVGDVATALIAPANAIDFGRLGTTPKLARMLTVIDSVNWPDIEKYLAKMIPEHLQYVPEGKFRLGFSVYGLNGVDVARLNAAGLSLKKVIKKAGRSVRIIPNKELELNTAQVHHNKLTDPTGWELLLIKDGSTTVLAQTFAVQNIEAYAARDQARPKRDAKVGMLPPKLAQTIVNLATGPKTSGRLLDPFCGTGVILQEAALMQYGVYGTDLEERMVRYSRDNLNWLVDKHKISFDWYLEVGDATSHQWQQPVDMIACETYLGRPFSAEPSPAVVEEIVRDVDTIHRKFLKNLAKQTEPGFRACIAVPAWKTTNGFKHLPTLDSLEELGYNRMDFTHAASEELIYHRENQVVGRELVTIIRK